MLNYLEYIDLSLLSEDEHSLTSKGHLSHLRLSWNSIIDLSDPLPVFLINLFNLN